MGTPLYTILVVEDSATMRYAYTQALEDQYTLIFADNPLSALTQVAEHRPDVVLLDINLRGSKPTDIEGEDKDIAKHMDGLDVCAAIKRSPFKDTPVLLLTGRDGLIDKMRGKIAHADYYLTKPISSEVLREKIREVLSPKIVSERLQTGTVSSYQVQPRTRR
jgi:CheY-like chemotaxis protein